MLLSMGLAILSGCYRTGVRHVSLGPAAQDGGPVDDSCWRMCRNREPRSVYMDCLESCPMTHARSGRCPIASDELTCQEEETHEIDGGKTALVAGGLAVVGVVALAYVAKGLAMTVLEGTFAGGDGE